MRAALSVCAVILLSAQVANAADNGFYLGGGVTRTSLDTSSDFVQNAPDDFDINDDDNGFKIIAGIRPFDSFAVEANYVDFGGVSRGDDALGGEYELKGYDAFAVGFLSVPFVDIFGKAGAIRWDADSRVTIAGADFTDSSSGTDLAWGAGVQARLGSLSGRLEYERFEVDDTDEVAMITLGLTYTFL